VEALGKLLAKPAVLALGRRKHQMPRLFAAAKLLGSNEGRSNGLPSLLIAIMLSKSLALSDVVTAVY
jgi:hypothetical protein